MDGDVQLVKALGDLLCDDEGADVLVLGEEDDDLVGLHLDPHVGVERILYDQSDEGAQHQVQVQR